MSDLLWQSLHEMRNRLAKLEAYIRLHDPEWDKPPAPEPASEPDPQDEQDAAENEETTDA